MGMAVSMAAMMAPTAAPFFLAYGRDTRRPAAIAAVVLLYVAVWAAAGLALDHLMNLAMIPTSLPVVGISVAIALVYAATPWGRWAREQCRQMSRREPRGPRFRDALAEGAGYTACCVVCSAGVMPVVIVLGMSNPLVIVAGAAVMLAYKAVPWSDPVTSPGFRRR
jgi:predicted metal-binding membrane protein